MHIESLAALPYMDLVLEMQRDLSVARTEAEIVYAFGSRFRQMTGATHLLDLDVAGLANGRFRVRDLIWIADPAFSPANAREASRWEQDIADVAVETGPVLSQLTTGSDPKYAREVPRQADRHLDDFGIDVLDLFAVPIFHGARIDEWLIVIGPTGAAFDNVQLRTGLANLNLLKRGIVQNELLAEVRGLSEALQDRIHEIARVQQSLLPTPTFRSQQMELAVSYRASNLASGDYYDFREFDSGHLGMMVADVSGHGPGAAVVMAMLRTMLSTYRLFNRSATTLITDINSVLRDTLPRGIFVTAVFVTVDPATGDGRYFNAGHAPPRIRRSCGIVERLDQDASPPLGILDELEPRGGRFQLAAGDTIVLHTDGLTEARAADGASRFGDDGLDRLLGQTGDPQALKALVEQALDAFAGNTTPDDDQCVVVARYRAA